MKLSSTHAERLIQAATSRRRHLLLALSVFLGILATQALAQEATVAG